MIENLSIAGDGAPCIVVNGTSAFFEIRNVGLADGGLSLSSASNSIIENWTIADSSKGMIVYDSTSIAIHNCNISS